MSTGEYLDVKIGITKRIALIAHDGKKPELIEWITKNKKVLRNHFLCGTGTTGALINEITGLPVHSYNSGPLGGDLQIGAQIVDGEIDLMIFLWDPLESQPHDPDIRALLRIAAVYDIPVATNLATADFIINSTLMTQEYSHKVANFKKNIQTRVDEQFNIKE